MKKLLLILLLPILLLKKVCYAQEVLVQKDSSPLVTLSFVFKTGAADDPYQKEGLAELTAALLTKGGSRDHSYAQLLDNFYPLATSLESQVDKEMTSFSVTTHQDNMEATYDLVKEMLLRPGFHPADFERLRSEQLLALDEDLKAANDEELGKEVLYHEIYRNHPYQHPNLGTRTGLEGIELSDARNFYQKHYARNLLTIGLAGPVDEAFVTRVKEDFSSLPATDATPKALPKAQPASGREITIVQKKTRSVAISLGFPIEVNRSHPDWTALWLVRSFFGEHRSENSYLYQRLREIRGLNYGDYAYIEYFPRGMFLTQPDPNYARSQQIFQIWIRPVEPQNAHFALRATLWELDRLVKDGLTAEQFETTRRFLQKNVALLLQTQARRLGYAQDDRFYGTLAFLERVRADLERLTHAQVQEAIRKHFQSQNLEIVMIAEDAAGLAQAVQKETPSPISYNAPKPESLLAEDRLISVYPVRSSKVRIVPLTEVFK